MAGPPTALAANRADQASGEAFARKGIAREPGASRWLGKMSSSTVEWVCQGSPTCAQPRVSTGGPGFNRSSTLPSNRVLLARLTRSNSVIGENNPG